MDVKKVTALKAIKEFCTSIYLLIILMVILVCACGYLVGLLTWWTWDA